jgi:hypothetical protein
MRTLRITLRRAGWSDEKPADEVHICRLEEESLGTPLSQLSDVACSGYHKDLDFNSITCHSPLVTFVTGRARQGTPQFERKRLSLGVLS